jgi:mRNA interferase MazF
MKRGEVRWALMEPRSGSEQRGRRPVVVVSHDGFNDIPSWQSIIVIPLTTSPKQALRGPTVVPLAAPMTGLPRESLALCHQITTLDRAKIEKLIGQLDEEALRRINAGIRAACDLEDD